MIVDFINTVIAAYNFNQYNCTESKLYQNYIPNVCTLCILNTDHLVTIAFTLYFVIFS